MYFVTDFHFKLAEIVRREIRVMRNEQKLQCSFISENTKITIVETFVFLVTIKGETVEIDKEEFFADSKLLPRLLADKIPSGDIIECQYTSTKIVVSNNHYGAMLEIFDYLGIKPDICRLDELTQFTVNHYISSQNQCTLMVMLKNSLKLDHNPTIFFYPC